MILVNHCIRPQYTAASNNLYSYGLHFNNGGGSSHGRRHMHALHNLPPQFDYPDKFEDNQSPQSLPIKKKRARCLKSILVLLVTVTFFFDITPNAFPSTTSTGMACVTQKCSSQLAKCISDPRCSKGLGCFVGCTAKDYIGQNDSEGVCQVRCMDLYESRLLNEFTECSLTQNQCYDPLKPDAR